MAQQLIPSKSDIYNEKIQPYLEEIVSMRSKGFNQTAVANSLGVKVNSFREYLVRYKDLYRAWRAGELGISEDYEAAAKRVATGYKYRETKKEIFYDADGHVTGRKVTEFEKFQAPNPQILSKSLEVMNPDKWGNQVQEETEIEIVIAEELHEYSE